jgi:hypothetical protein
MWFGGNSVKIGIFKNMKIETIYSELKNVAEKLGMTVVEHSFRNAGIRVRSGYCKVRNKNKCIVDRNLKLNRKAEILAECILDLPHESIFIIPAVREYLDTFQLSYAGSYAGSVEQTEPSNDHQV